MSSNPGANSSNSIANKSRLNTSRSASQTPSDQKLPPQKAWTGQSLAQRSFAAASQPNGIANGRSNGVASATTNSNKAASPEKLAHDRLVFLLSNFTGLDATVVLKNGDKYSGIFTGMPPNQPRYVLKMTRRLQADGQPASEFLGQEDDHVMSFDVQDTIDLQVQNASLTTLTTKATKGTSGPSFKTDVEISGTSDMSKERELHRWQPGADTSVDLSMDSGGIGDWDQFAANEKLYNVRSDFDENLYTTAIDRTDPKYKQAEQRAARLAREIERDSTSRKAPEADSGLDEEDKYSGVIRNPPTQTKAGQEVYVPPSRRPAQAKPTASGAAYDPAIIFSQIARPGGPSSRTGAGAAAQSASEKRVRDTTDPAATQTADATQNSTATAKGDASSGKVNVQPAKDGQAPSKKTENYYQDVYESFKQFTVSEKQRIQNHQKALAQQRNTNAKQEKSVKLNDLRKFSQNFKLTSRVPEDLVPILAKSKEKQNEIRDKAEQQALTKEHTSEKSPPIGTDAKSPPITQATVNKDKSATTATKDTKPSLPSGSGKLSSVLPINNTGSQLPSKTDSGLASPSFAAPKLNVKAMEFKPNPGAASFAPAGRNPSPGPRTSARPSVSSPSPVVAERPQAVFTFSKPAIPYQERPQSLDEAFNPLRLMLQETAADEQKRQQAARNGGIPYAYRTAPTWEVPEANMERSYVDFFMHPQSRSPMPISRTNSGMMPHQHQLPPHLQGGPSPGQNSPRFVHTQPQPYGHLGPDEQRMHYGQGNHRQRGNGPQGFMYNGQMPPQMPGYAYGIPHGSIGPGGHMRPMGANGQFISTGPMSPMGAGGHVMVQQPSNGPPPQQFGIYSSPGANHAQPHMVPGQMGGYAGSPRAHPMSHQGSQQSHSGYNLGGPNGPMMMSPQPGGQMPPMRGMSQPQFPGSYAMQQRAMSGQGNTPRQ